MQTEHRPVGALTRRDEIAVAFFGTWMVIGLHLDGWAHVHQRPETIFTPWHAVLYSGIVGGVLYFIAGTVRTGGATTADKLMLRGLAIFAVGAIGDLIWHTIFGIEVSIRAFLSPTHLMLMMGGILMVSGPVRAAAARGMRPVRFREFFPTLVSLTIPTIVVTFFMQFLTPYHYFTLTPDSFGEVYAIASVFLVNTLLVVVVLYMASRFDTPIGTHAFLFGAVAAGAQSLVSFRQPLHIVAAVAAGLAVDVTARRASRRELSVAIATPIALWTTWLGAIALLGGVHWPIELPIGIVALAALEGWGLYVLSSSPSPTERTSPASA